MQEATLKPDHLSTVGELSPLKVLEPFGKDPMVVCVVATWTRQTMSGSLEEKGIWMHSFWDAATKSLPQAGGCRLLWNTVFFAVPDAGVEQVAQRFSDLLQAHQDASLMSFCVLCEVQGEPKHKLDVLDVLGHEVGATRDFGTSREYRPNGYRFYHLLDGKPYLTK